MRAFWFDPYLWIHLAGLAAVPLFLALCLLGVSVGDPVLPAWLELLLIGAIGVAPVLWMQWQRPFYIFSLLVLTLKPEQLTDDQRRLLTLFRVPRNQIAAVVVALGLLVLLPFVYNLSAIATEVVPLPASWRPLGLGIAALAFLAVNLFLQVPVSVTSVMLHSPAQFAQTEPFPTPQVRGSFMVLGLPVSRLVPPLQMSPPAQPTPSAVTAGGTASENEALVSDPWDEASSATAPAPPEALMTESAPTDAEPTASAASPAPTTEDADAAMNGATAPPEEAEEATPSSPTPPE